MRNAFVVLVSLCIGLVSGFIVPSSAPENTVKNSLKISNNTSKDVKVKSTMLFPKHAILPRNRSNIDENDLYEHATEKRNNQSERAFIFINQKFYKKPRNKLINMSSIDKSNLAYTFESNSAVLPSTVQTPWPPSAFDSAPNINSNYQSFNLAGNKKQQDTAPYFEVPNILRYKLNDDSKNAEKVKVKMQVPVSHRANGQRDYLELLKPPLLRPADRKSKYDNIHNNELPYEENYLKKYYSKNLYINKDKESVARQNELRKKYGFNGAFIRRPAYQPNELTNRAEDANFGEDFVTEEDFRRNYENNQVDDKLLAKYLKETLEDIPSMNTNDKGFAHSPDCTQEDCILEPHKTYPKHKGLLVKPDCQCSRNPNFKRAEPKDRALREGNNRDENTSKSLEVISYDEILTDDSNMMKQADDVIRPPKRFNQG